MAIIIDLHFDILRFAICFIIEISNNLVGLVRTVINGIIDAIEKFKTAKTKSNNKNIICFLWMTTYCKHEKLNQINLFF